MRARVLCLLLLCFAAEGFAAKKDFKGLFGSYRREKFTENEARASDLGIDIMLSTLFPTTTLVTNTEAGVGTNGLHYANFFNAEVNLTYTLGYHWELYGSIGWFTYSTRRQNSVVASASEASPQTESFDLMAAPAILGVKYRFSTSDIVPYIGLGAGLAYVQRRTTFDYSPVYDNHFSTAIAAQGTVGLQFYISPRMGIRLEASAMYLGLTARPVTVILPTPITATNYQGSLIAVRYASGLFILF